VRNLITGGAILMRNKILPDLLVYILSPIIVLSMVNVVDIRYFAIGLVPLISIYSIIVRTKYNRINLSGIVFSFLYIIFSYYKQNIQAGYDTYVYNTYFLIISAIIIVLISLFNKNIIKQVYIDILKCKDMSPLEIWNQVKKSENIYYFNKINHILVLQILSIILIRVYSMNTYGINDYTYTKELEILINTLFIMGEIYISSKLFNKIKKEDSILINKNVKVNNSSRRVINFNKYKNMSK